MEVIILQTQKCCVYSGNRLEIEAGVQPLPCETDTSAGSVRACVGWDSNPRRACDEWIEAWNLPASPGFRSGAKGA